MWDIYYRFIEKNLENTSVTPSEVTTEVTEVSTEGGNLTEGRKIHAPHKNNVILDE